MTSLPPAFRAALARWMDLWEGSLRESLPPGAFLEIKVYPADVLEHAALAVAIVDGRNYDGDCWFPGRMAGWPPGRIAARVVGDLEAAHRRLHDAMIDRVARSLKTRKRTPKHRGDCP